MTLQHFLQMGANGHESKVAFYFITLSLSFPARICMNSKIIAIGNTGAWVLFKTVIVLLVIAVVVLTEDSFITHQWLLYVHRVPFLFILFFFSRFPVQILYFLNDSQRGHSFPSLLGKTVKTQIWFEWFAAFPHCKWCHGDCKSALHPPPGCTRVVWLFHNELSWGKSNSRVTDSSDLHPLWF